MTRKEDQLTLKPLAQFSPGDLLHFKFMLASGHDVHCPAEFVGIVRGLVRVRCLDGWEPDWLDSNSLEKKYPGRIATVRAKNCYLFVRADDERQPTCHWFEDTKSSAKFLRNGA